jgi:hypothetical protein
LSANVRGLKRVFPHRESNRGSKKLPNERDHHVGPASELVSEAVDESNRPTEALELPAVLPNPSHVGRL